MSTRITATFDDDTADAIKRLAAMEQRSESQMVAPHSAAAPQTAQY